MALLDVTMQAVITMFNGDSGTGGVYNSASTAYCRGGFYRYGDPNYMGDRSPNRPWIEVEALPEESQGGFGTAKPGGTVVVRVHVHEDRDYLTGSGGATTSFVRYDAIMSRIRKLLSTSITVSGGLKSNQLIDPAGTLPWKFSVNQAVREIPAQYTDKEVHGIVEFMVEANQT